MPRKMVQIAVAHMVAAIITSTKIPLMILAIRQSPVSQIAIVIKQYMAYASIDDMAYDFKRSSKNDRNIVFCHSFHSHLHWQYDIL